MSVTELKAWPLLFPVPNKRTHQEGKSESFKADRTDLKRDPWTEFKVCNGALSPQEPVVCLRWPSLNSWETTFHPQLNKDCAHADLLYSPFYSLEESFVRPVLKWEELAALWLLVRGSCNRQLSFALLTQGRYNRYRHIQWTKPSHLSFCCSFCFSFQRWDFQF